MLKQKLFLGVLGAGALALSVGSIFVSAYASAKTGAELYTQAVKDAQMEMNLAIKNAQAILDEKINRTPTDATSPAGIYAKAIADAKAKYKIASDAVVALQNSYNQLPSGTIKSNVLASLKNAKVALSTASGVLKSETSSAKIAFDNAKIPFTDIFNASKKSATANFNVRKATLDSVYKIYKADLKTAQDTYTNNLKTLTQKFNSDKVLLKTALEVAKTSASTKFSSGI